MKPVRWSNLRYMAKSPAHYRYVLEHGVAETAAMRVGSRTNGLLIGGGWNFAVYPGRRAGKEWEKWRDAQGEGTIILNLTEEEAAQGAYRSAAADEKCKELFVGEIETKITWMAGDRECSGTPDALSRAGQTLVDLKVTADASPGKFVYHAARQGWLGQLVWYADGIGLGADAQLYIVAVESKPPHVVTVYRLTERAIDLGRRTWRSLFERLLVCEESGCWPGYSQTVVDLDSPEDLMLTVEGEEVWG